jgi:ATP-dependent DNA helicase RecG
LRLKMFSEDPSVFFPNTEVDLVSFPHGEAAPYTEYPKITGPIPEQTKRTPEFLKTNVLEERVLKSAARAESIRTWSYPLQAIEETLVNAFYHRDYQKREPIEIRIYPQSIIFINHGGPDRSIQLQAFQTGQVRARRYRNRRLGDFLKELDLTEGRATGIPTIFKALKDNGSPLPRFNTDEDRTFFEVELFIHPPFPDSRALPDVPQNEDKPKAFNKVLTAIDEKVNHAPSSYSDRVGRTVGDMAGALRKDVPGKLGQVLAFCHKPQPRKEVLQEIGPANNAKNYNTYVLPLVALGWVSMTLPGKPTSPKQQYRTTLKGAIIARLMNRPH